MLTGEHSWVDRMWSITPVVYVVWFSAAQGRLDPRLALMSMFV